MDKMRQKDQIKVLLISGTPFRTDTNVGKTLMTLFADFDRTELCQFYFSPEIPNTDVCGSYYQICEKQMVESLFGTRKKRCGGIITPAMDGSSRKPETNPPLLTRGKEKIDKRIAREAIWRLTHWKNDSFIAWLEQENPNVIFTIMHDTNGAARAVSWIAKKYGLPVVMFVTDDYYNDPKASKNPFRQAYYQTRKKVNQQMAVYCNALVGCSEKAAEYFAGALKIRGGGALYPLRRCLFSNAL